MRKMQIAARVVHSSKPGTKSLTPLAQLHVCGRPAALKEQSPTRGFFVNSSRKSRMRCATSFEASWAAPVFVLRLARRRAGRWSKSPRARAAAQPWCYHGTIRHNVDLGCIKVAPRRNSDLGWITVAPRPSSMRAGSSGPPRSRPTASRKARSGPPRPRDRQLWFSASRRSRACGHDPRPSDPRSL